MRPIRTPSLATASASVVALAALVAGCAGSPGAPINPQAQVGGPYPGSYPSYPAATPVQSLEFARVTSIDYLPAGTAAPASGNILGTVVGGVAGAVLGHQIGGGTGRDVATAAGALGGAAVGNRIARNAQGQTTAPGYRITVQTEGGVLRTYEVPSPGDLRVGDRVRIENGVLYRS